MMDQTERLRRYIQEYDSKKNNGKSSIRVISVSSGKGGVGKTNFSVNLAVSLKEKGYNVVVFDADLGLANVDVITGVVPKYTLYDVIFNNKSMEDIIMNGPGGIQIIPGGSGNEGLLNLSDIQTKFLSERFEKLKDTDILIIDTGAGISKNVMGFMAMSDENIVVTTPEPTSVTDAYGLIKVAFKYTEGHGMHLVINRVKSEGEARLTFERLEKAIKIFLGGSLNYLGYIFEDRNVEKAVMEQTPFKVLFPMCPASKCIDTICCEITGLENQGIAKRTTDLRDFFTKVAYIFTRSRR